MTGRLRVLQVLAVSSLTGCTVGGCVAAASAALAGASVVASLAYGAPAGAVIGLVAAGAFLGFSLNAGRRPVASFVSVGPIVGAGAVAANLAAGLSLGPVFLASVAVSVALGYLTTAFWFRSYRRWNDRLEAYQRLAAGGKAEAVRDP
jgi:hypothetical protein